MIGSKWPHVLAFLFHVLFAFGGMMCYRDYDQALGIYFIAMACTFRIPTN